MINNALALFNIADAKNEKIRLLYHNCQGNSGSRVGPLCGLNAFTDSELAPPKTA